MNAELHTMGELLKRLSCLQRLSCLVRPNSAIIHEEPISSVTITTILIVNITFKAQCMHTILVGPLEIFVCRQQK